MNLIEFFDYWRPTCDMCGQKVNEVFTVDGMEICDDCYDNNYTRCDGCGKDVPNDEIVVEHCDKVSYNWCNDCAKMEEN